MQALYLLALDPVAETTADPNSYGFRPQRSTADAIEQCFTALGNIHTAQWILEGDIKGCLDAISLSPYPNGQGHPEEMVTSGVDGKSRPAPDRRRHTPRGHHLSRTRQYDLGWLGKEVTRALPKNNDQRDRCKSQLRMVR